MKWKFMVHFALLFFISACLANRNNATPVSTSDGSNTEEANSRILCETVCSKPRWHGKFDKEKSACVCTVGDDYDIDETEERRLQLEAKKYGLKLLILKKAIIKRDITKSKSEDPPKSSTLKKNKEDDKKLKKIKKIELVKQPVLEATPNKESSIDGDNQKNVLKNEEKNDVGKEKLPTITSKSKDIQHESATEEKTNFKREHKDESEETTPKNSHSKLKNHLKELKESKASIVGESEPKHKLIKPILPPKTITNLVCTGASARHQLELAVERINKLIEKTHKQNFHCPQINPEIENIKGLLQQVTQRNTEIKHREFDKTKIMEQIREREKERQARMQARFGHLDMVRPKHRHNLVGGLRSTEKTPSIPDKIKSHNVIVEPENLIDT